MPARSGSPYPWPVATASELLTALADYREARLRLLQLIEVPVSNRDPLAEFSERLVAAVWGGTCSPFRNQPGWDVRLPDGTTVQVKYLTNDASGRWQNIHEVRLVNADAYAVVMIENFTVVGIAMFPCNAFQLIGKALGKRGSLGLDQGWDLTRTVWLRFRDEPETFRPLGVQVRLPPDFG